MAGMPPLPFDLVPLRLEFRARDELYFPPGKAANILRGAFGMALLRVADTAGAALFDPQPDGPGPSGLADPPRPFVFRVRHLDGRRIRSGESFTVGLNLFTLDTGAREIAVRAFDDAAREGFGPGRGRAEFQGAAGDPISIDLSAVCDPVACLRVEFLTPTELKHEGRLADRPEFGILAARLRDRIGALRAFYGAGSLPIDFAAFGARAAAVRLTTCELHNVDLERRSSRTGQTHPIGGFAGLAEYAGDVAEFLPYLEAARWTGVGRQAVWGKGELAVSRIM
jgi:hypothetical protein